MQPLPTTLRRQRLAAAALPQAVAAAAASGPARDLAVADVTWFPVREPESDRRYSVIRVQTVSGLQGWGECVPLTEDEFRAGSAALKGHAATAVEPVRGALATYPGFQAAANIALLDIASRAARVPLYQFLGGPTRNKARALAAIPDEPAGNLRDQIKRASAHGYRAFSVPVPAPSAMNHGKAYLNEIRLRMDQLRETAGESADFVLDGNNLLSPGDASSVASLCERDYLLWLDRPCPLANMRAIRKITEESVTPVGFGHEVQRAGDFQNLLSADVLDVLRPSIGRNGITAIRKMAALAETYYVAIAPHHDGGPVGTAAAIHLAASLPNFVVQETPFTSGRAAQARAAIAPASIEKPVDGFFALPTGPGLGFSIDEKALNEYKERQA